MFVFPANDAGYRKRKRVHQACEQCKRRRKRCNFPIGSVRCKPCEGADIVCSLAPDYEPAEKASRLDKLFSQGYPLADRAEHPLRSYDKNGLNPDIYATANKDSNTASASSLNSAGHWESTLPFKPLTLTSDPSFSTSSDIAGSEFTAAPYLSVPRVNSSASYLDPIDSEAYLPAGTNSNGRKSHSTPTETSNDRESIGVWVKGDIGQQRLNPHLYTYLASINAFSMPLRSDRDALIELYCQYIDPLLPLLDKEQFIKLHNIGQTPTLLLHAVLLAAARHDTAARYLGNQSVRQFCSATATKIRALLFAEVERDRLTLVRVHALLSLHSEGPDGLENSCSDIQKAIHYAVSLGIHHKREFHERDKLTNLWWSVWCLDRMSACVNARPLTCNLEDVDIDKVEKNDNNYLGHLVEVCTILERVIYLYRPKNKQLELLPYFDLPVSDESLSNPFAAILNLIQTAAFILTHRRDYMPVAREENNVTDRDFGENNIYTSMEQRFSGLASEDIYLGLPLETPQPPQSKLSTLVLEDRREIIPPSGRNKINQNLLSAATNILRIINCRTDLPPLPFIPYCVSLTLTVFLRTYPVQDSSGYSWTDSCSVLDRMSNKWWVAGAMGNMGRNVFEALASDNVQVSLNSDLELDSSTLTENPSLNQSSNLQPQSNSTGSNISEKARNQSSLKLDDSFTGQSTMEEKFLDMFSDLPNQTSFLDEILTLEQFNNVGKWFESGDL